VPLVEGDEVNVALDPMAGNHHIADSHVECRPTCDAAEGNSAGSIQVHKHLRADRRVDLAGVEFRQY
jgi:hypothetical protein